MDSARICTTGGRRLSRLSALEFSLGVYVVELWAQLNDLVDRREMEFNCISARY